MDLNRLSSAQKLSAGAIVGVVIGAFLPWVSIFGVSVLGIRGDGALTLIMALAGGAVLAVTNGLFGEPKGAGKAADIALVVLAVLVALIGLFDLNGVAAIGLYLTFFAGLAWVVGAVWELRTAKPAESPASPE